MSKTYKHQNRYLARHWSGNYSDMPWVLTRNWCIEIGVGEYRSYANKIHRKRWRRALQTQDMEKIDRLNKKPDNVDWDIW